MGWHFPIRAEAFYREGLEGYNNAHEDVPDYYYAYAARAVLKDFTLLCAYTNNKELQGKN